jgi:hypothetical protein
MTKAKKTALEIRAQSASRQTIKSLIEPSASLLQVIAIGFELSI